MSNSVYIGHCYRTFYNKHSKSGWYYEIVKANYNYK